MLPPIRIDPVLPGRATLDGAIEGQPNPVMASLDPLGVVPESALRTGLSRLKDKSQGRKRCRLYKDLRRWRDGRGLAAVVFDGTMTAAGGDPLVGSRQVMRAADSSPQGEQHHRQCDPTHV